MNEITQTTDTPLGFNKTSSLRRTLAIWFILLAIVPMFVISIITYFQTRSSLIKITEEKLILTTQAKTVFLQNWFDFRVRDLNVQAENIQNSNFIISLRAGLLKSGLTPDEFIKSSEWAKITEQSQYNLIFLKLNYSYIYDLFLIDIEGNILYSVMHETDLGTNLYKGSLSNTRFAQSVQKTLQTGNSFFSDLEHYAPSNNSLTGFLTAPLLNEFGIKIGVFAIQLKIDEMIQQINQVGANVHSWNNYLVGKDGYLRTTIDGSHHDILKQIIDTRQFRLWKKEHTGNKTKTDSQEEKVLQYIGPNGKEVLGIHQSILLPGISWSLISEIDRSEALADANWLGIVILILVSLTILIVTSLGFYKAKQITRPILRLANASKAAAEGNLEQEVPIVSSDEIGLLSASFNNMLLNRRNYLKELQASHFQTSAALNDLAEQKLALDEHSIVAITDIKGTITSCNDKFTRISGYSRDELIGQNHRLLNSGHHPKDFFTDMYKHISKGKSWNADICNKAKDGHLYWVDSTIIPTRNSDGKLSGYIAIRTDITELKRIEESLNEAIQTADNANQAKSEFLANMSHEIRTPMNGVLGMTTLLLDGNLDHQQRQRMETLKRSAESLLVVINDILDFSKIEAGKLEIELIDFDMGTLIEDFAATMVHPAEEKNIELICPADPIVQHWFIGDPGRIRQILTNLVGNALKFTQQGEVAVHYEVTTTHDGRNRIQFTITDTGIGLSTEQQHNLFQRFNQADGSTTRQFGGTGLGLSICKQLVEMMDGEIGVHSEPDKGSSFWFSLILATAKPQSPPPKTQQLDAQNILVVDDNATTLKFLDKLLNHWQIDHQLVNNGADAIQQIHQAKTPFTIALIDKNMPLMDGLEFGDLIHSDKKTSNIRTVLLTSTGQHGEAREIEQAGFSGYLSKPLNPSQLYPLLLQIVGIGSSERRLVTPDTAKEITQFKARILVVDDNITNQQVAKGMLEKFGLRVDAVGNGEEALVSLQQLPYDLVFMDCQMPVMDGYEATRNIRDQQTKVLQHSIPIVAMTANVMPKDLKKCTQVGMDDYLSKPVDPDKLFKILEKWLPEETQQQNTEQFETAGNKHKNKISAQQDVTETVFDYQSFSSRLMHDSDLIRTVLEAFLPDMAQQISIFKAMVSDKNLLEITSQAHKIKGASANIGGIALCEFALKMEQLGKKQDLETIQQTLEQFENEFLTLKQAIEKQTS